MESDQSCPDPQNHLRDSSAAHLSSKKGDWVTSEQFERIQKLLTLTQAL